MSPRVMRVPTRVTMPLRLSVRGDDTTRVEPGSVGSMSAMHSERPDLRDRRVSRREESNQANSRAVDADSWAARASRAIVGQMDVDISADRQVIFHFACAGLERQLQGLSNAKLESYAVYSGTQPSKHS